MATWVTVCTFIITASVLDVSRGANWLSGPEDGTSQYACAGRSLALPWKLSLSPGDVIHDIQWLYTGRSEELIAVFSHGSFLPLPAFADRVQFVANGGIQISHLTALDTGNYTVEVSWNDASGALFILRRSVFVQAGVADGVLVGDGDLHMTMNPAAVLNTTSNQWTVELRCGRFNFPGQPSFDLQWISPSGTVEGSSGYRDGHFLFHLPTPVTGGNYTCRVSAQSTHGCLPDKEASLIVDTTFARLSILEAQRAADQAHLLSLEAKQAASEAIQAQQALQLTALQAENSHLKEQLDNTAALSRRRVSFHARYLQSHVLHPRDTLVPNDVILNQGGAYDSRTGHFTAPYSGTYFLAATTGPDYTVKGSWTPMTMSRDSGPSTWSYTIAQTDAHDEDGQETATIHAVLHLNVGQRVFLRNMSNNSTFWKYGTMFSGFLIAPDK